jgi:hypothetical protein
MLGYSVNPVDCLLYFMVLWYNQSGVKDEININNAMYPMLVNAVCGDYAWQV